MSVHAFVCNLFFSELSRWNFLIFCMKVGIYKRSKLIDLYVLGKFLSVRNGPKLGLSYFIQNLSHEMYFRRVLYERTCLCMRIEYYSMNTDIWKNFDFLVICQNARLDCWAFQIAISQTINLIWYVFGGFLSSIYRLDDKAECLKKVWFCSSRANYF